MNKEQPIKGKEEILKKHIAKYYQHKWKNVNNDDILPVSRIIPLMEEYAKQFQTPIQSGEERWISVEEKPKKRIRVIGWPDIGGYDMVHLDNDDIWKTDDGKPVKYPIILWQPLPKPPSLLSSGQNKE